jgi:Zn-dependent peptidase ImmA (M78 family)/transcriptional regulator with XRE-family HTH domain
MDFDLFQFETGVRLVPARLKEAREAKNLSMTELAERVGVTTSAISAFESDLKQPEWNTLMRIAEKLEQPTSYFTSCRPDGGEFSSTAFFRSFKSRTKSCNRMLKRWTVWAAQVVDYIGSIVNLPEPVLPSIERKIEYSDEDIERIATECRRLWGLSDGPITNMVALLESKGFIVIRLETGEDNLDAFSSWQDGRPFIVLADDKKCAVRSRFDAAHELGHMILHRYLSQDDIEDVEVLNKIEHEANRFAASFLLPAKTFISEIYSSSIQQFVELKRRWKVAISAMIFRCKDLGVFDERLHVNLRKQLSFKGWIKREPLDDDIPVERPQLLCQCIKLIIGSGVKATTDFITELRLSAKALALIVGCELSIFANEEEIPKTFPLTLKPHTESF